jgi:hypothetical protein
MKGGRHQVIAFFHFLHPFFLRPVVKEVREGGRQKTLYFSYIYIYL